MAVVLVGCEAGFEETGTSVSPTAASGVTSQIFARVHMPVVNATGENHNTGWDVELKGDASDVVTQVIYIAPGGHAGWHSHPGPHFGSVTTGTLTLYDAANCHADAYPAGTGFVDSGGGHHIARNHSSETVTLWVTYVIPPGAPLRIDMPDPGNCP